MENTEQRMEKPSTSQSLKTLQKGRSDVLNKRYPLFTVILSINITATSFFLRRLNRKMFIKGNVRK